MEHGLKGLDTDFLPLPHEAHPDLGFDPAICHRPQHAGGGFAHAFIAGTLPGTFTVNARIVFPRFFGRTLPERAAPAPERCPYAVAFALFAYRFGRVCLAASAALCDAFPLS